MKENEWISCDERLPKVNEKILVGNKQEGCHVTDIGENVFSSYYDCNLYRHGYIWLVPMNGITHWRRIPEKQPDFSKINNEITDTDRMDFLENESETRKWLINQFDGKTYRELVDEKIMEYKK